MSFELNFILSLCRYGSLSLLENGVEFLLVATNMHVGLKCNICTKYSNVILKKVDLAFDITNKIPFSALPQTTQVV